MTSSWRWTRPSRAEPRTITRVRAGSVNTSREEGREDWENVPL